MPQYELNFRDYLRVFRKRRFIIIITLILCVVLAGIYNNLQTPIYQAEVVVRLEGRQTVYGVLAEKLIWKEAEPLETETKMIQSRLIAEGVAKRLGLINPDRPIQEKEGIISSVQNSISAEVVAKTNLIKIIVVSTDSKRARDLANTTAQVYSEVNLEQKLRQIKKMRDFLEEQLATVEEKLKTSEENLKVFRNKETVTGLAIPLQNKLLDLQTQLKNLLSRATEKHPEIIRLKEQIADIEQQLKTLPTSELTYARLDREVIYSEKLFSDLRQKLDVAKMSEQEKVSDVILVSQATEPKYPMTQNKTTRFALSGLTGLLLGFIIAFVIENLDTSIGTIEDVEGILKLPVLGVIPSVRLPDREDLKAKQKKRFMSLRKGYPKRELDLCSVCLVVQYQPHSPVSEAYRILRTNLKISPQRKAILFSSTGPQEGKTTVLVSLGLVFAQMGTRVVIVDTDLRRPAVSKIFGIEREPGLTDIIAGTLKLNDVLRGLSDILLGKTDISKALKTPGLDNLNILPSGHIPANPAELLGSAQMSNIIDELKNNFDVVLFDSPPALSISDAAILSPKLDGVVLVYEMGRTARAALLRVKIQLESVGAKMLGVVLNHIQPETEIQSSYYPYYHYKYKYYQKQPEDEGDSKKERPK